jgi:hypothetical protein
MDKAGGGVDHRTGSCSSVAHQNSAPGDHCHHDQDDWHHRYDAHFDKHLEHFDQHLHIDKYFDHADKHRHHAYNGGRVFDSHSRTAVCRRDKAGLLIAPKSPLRRREGEAAGPEAFLGVGTGSRWGGFGPM